MRAREELDGLARAPSSSSSTSSSFKLAATELPAVKLDAAAAHSPTAFTHEQHQQGGYKGVPTLDELVEKSRHDAIVGLQRWWRRHHGNQKRVTELQELVRVHAKALIRKKRDARIRAKIRELLLHTVFLYFYSTSTSAEFARERVSRFTITPVAQLVHAEFAVPAAAGTAASSATPELKTFYRIANAPELFAWLRGPFLALAYPPASTTSSSSSGGNAGSDDLVFQTSRVIGGIRVGQLRVVQTDCTSRVTSYFSTSAVDASTGSAALYCYGGTHGDFDTDLEATESFGDDDAFEFAGLNDTDTLVERAQRFSSMSIGAQTLPAPAFSVVLPRADTSRARAVLDWMERSAYVDARTRVVVLDLSLFNVMLRHVLALRFVFTFPASGGVVPTLAATSAPVTKSFLFDSEQLAKSASDIVVLAFYAYFLASELLAHTGRRRKAAALRALQWSSRFGSTARVLSLVLYVLVWLLRLVALVNFPPALPLESDAFVTLRAFTEPLHVAQHVLAVNTCLCWLVLLLLLRVSRNVDVFVRTVLVAKTKLLSLLICMALLLYGYASALVVALGTSHDARGFESVAAAMHSLLRLAFALGGRGAAAASDAPHLLVQQQPSTPIRTVLLAAFALLHACVLANLCLVVVYEAYKKALEDVERQQQQSAHRRVRLVVEIGRYIAALFAQLCTTLAKCCTARRAKTTTLAGRTPRLEVVHAISSSRIMQRSAKLLSSHVGALSSLGGKLVHTVVSSERSDASEYDEYDGDDDDNADSEPSRRGAREASGHHALLAGAGGARRHRAGVWTSSGGGSGGGRGGAGTAATGGDGASTKLLQGMILQLALQNESLIRSLDEIRSDVKHLTALNSMDGTSRRALLSPSSQSRLGGRSHSRRQTTLLAPPQQSHSQRSQHSQHSLPHLEDHVEVLESGSRDG